MTLREKVLTAIRRDDMVSPHTPVTVGLSGGADSVALLHVLLQLQAELEISVSAVHINHGLRGEEALRDEAFVKALCAEWNVPLTVCSHNVAAIAKARHLGVEEAGREVRYACFSQCDGVVATAHTASDNAETVLLHLCRGTGLHGLTGIPSVRGNVIRPLIDCTRAEVEAYCEENRLSYVTDSTNADTAYARNRIRRCVLPQLKEINPQAEEAIARLVASAKEWEAYLASRAEDALQCAQNGDGTFSKKALLSLEPAVLSEVLRRLVGEQGRQRGSDYHIRQAAETLKNGGRLSLPANRQLSVFSDKVSIEPVTASEGFYFSPAAVGERYDIGGKTWTLLCLSCENCEQFQNISKKLFANALDYDKICGSLVLRGRLSGDRYHPAGRRCGKTLKQLCNEASLTDAQREALPVLCDDNGVILVPSFGCDERVRITPETKTALILKIEEDV